ncbi:MAG: glycoside hydrolase domain-containing protein [Phycisphaerae bacterium]
MSRYVCAAGVALAIFYVPLSAQVSRPAGTAPTSGPAGRTILCMAGNWRAFYVLKAPVVRDGGKLDVRSPEVDSPPPPEGWAGADFDDSTWQRLHGQPCQPNLHGAACAEANAGFHYLDGSSPFQSLICLRGRFLLPDGSQARDLSLSVDYRGGAVVYLNGKEVGRGNMPAGELRPDTPADDYPPETFFAADGKLLKEDWRTKDPQVIEAWKRIKRHLDIKVPAGLMRKGVNVLAVEVHRSAYPKAYDEAAAKNRAYEAVPFVRSTCGITELVLTAPEGGGPRPNTQRPEGVQVWNSTPLAPDPYGFGDPCEPLRPIQIVACRNGRFGGEVTIGSRTAITHLQARITDLAAPAVKGVIPAARVAIRYTGATSAPAEIKPVVRSQYSRWKYAGAPEELPGAVQPITVTVDVPKDAPPGDYEGKLTVTADGGGPFEVPVKVSVSAFTLPDPRDYQTMVDIIQSPDTLALQYGCPLWSDEHWKLIDKSFEVLGTAGLCTIYLPMIAETHFGNEQSIVRWVSKGEGKYDYDFTILEKYLDAFEKRCGRAKVVCLYVWELTLEGGSDWVNYTGGFMTPEIVKAREEHAKLKLGPAVTLLDPATGKCSKLQLPQYSQPESLGLWQGLYDRLRAILKKRGLEGKAMLGIPLDPKPTREVTQLFNKLMPDTPWLVQDHLFSAGEVIGGMPVAYQANVFLSELATHDVAKSKFGTKHPELRLEFNRDLAPNRTPQVFALQAELDVMSGLRGFGRLGGDLWPALKTSRGGRQMVTFRYPVASAGGLSVWTWILEPGADGPIAPPRFELLREGVQQTEARIVVEKALLAGALPPDLAARCRKLLEDRNRATLLGLRGKINDPHVKQWWENSAGYSEATSARLWYLSSGYDARNKALFDLAAEVARTASKGMD